MSGPAHNVKAGDLIDWAGRRWRVRDGVTTEQAWFMCEAVDGEPQFVGFARGDFSPRPDGTEPRVVEP